MFKPKFQKKSLKATIAGFTCISGLLVIATGWSDFQNVTVYEIGTHLNNQSTYRLIQRQYDRELKDLPPNAVKISRIDQGRTLSKFLFAIGGLSLSTITLLMVAYENKLESILEYIDEKRNETDKMAADNEVALADYLSDQELLIRHGEIQRDLEKNPFWVRLQAEKDIQLYGDEEAEDTQPTQTNYSKQQEKEIADAWADFEVVGELCTQKQAQEIWNLHKEKDFSLSTAILQVTGKVSSSDNWDAFKSQLLTHIKALGAK